MADEKQLHLVEMRKEKLYYPTVLASPAVVSKSNDSDETFSEYVMGGLPLRKKKKPKELLPQYELHLKKMHYRRNHEQVRLKLIMEYGECRSFLADIYPECRHITTRRKSGENEITQE